MAQNWWQTIVLEIYIVIYHFMVSVWTMSCNCIYFRYLLFVCLVWMGLNSENNVMWKAFNQTIPVMQFYIKTPEKRSVYIFHLFGIIWGKYNGKSIWLIYHKERKYFNWLINAWTHICLWQMASQLNLFGTRCLHFNYKFTYIYSLNSTSQWISLHVLILHWTSKRQVIL